MRIKQPSTLAGKNIVLTGKGVARVAGANGELFDRCPYELLHNQGILPSAIVSGAQDYIDVYVGGNLVGVNEKQNLLFSDVPVAGELVLSFGGVSTDPIAFGDITAAGIQAALEALSTIGTGNVTVTEVVPTEFLVEFVGTLKSMPNALVVEVTNTLVDDTSPTPLAVTLDITEALLGAYPEPFAPELDMSGVYQLDESIVTVSPYGNNLVNLNKVEFVRNPGV